MSYFEGLDVKNYTDEERNLYEQEKENELFLVKKFSPVIKLINQAFDILNCSYDFIDCNKNIKTDNFYIAKSGKYLIYIYKRVFKDHILDESSLKRGFLGIKKTTHSKRVIQKEERILVFYCKIHNTFDFIREVEVSEKYNNNDVKLLIIELQEQVEKVIQEKQQKIDYEKAFLQDLNF